MENLELMESLETLETVNYMEILNQINESIIQQNIYFEQIMELITSFKIALFLLVFSLALIVALMMFDY